MHRSIVDLYGASKRYGNSQAKMARELKEHRSVINRELRGKRELSVPRIAELANLMGHDVKLVFTPHATTPDGNQPAKSTFAETKVAKTNVAAHKAKEPAREFA